MDTINEEVAFKVNDFDCLLDERSGPEGESSRSLPTLDDDTTSIASSKINTPCGTMKFCRFERLGCKFKGNRFEIDLHMDIASETHLDILCKSILDIKTEYIRKENKIIAKHDKQIKTLQEYITKQNIIIKDLHSTQKTMENTLQTSQKQQKEISQKSSTILHEISRLKIQSNVLQDELNDVKETRQCGTMLWKIENLEQHLRSAKDKTEISIYSQPFYTSKNGYKLQIQLFLNGVGQHTGEYVALFFHIIPTEHDSILEWPFNKNITISLLQQDTIIESAQNITYTVVPNTSHPFYARPSNNMSDGQGCTKFVTLHQLLNNKYIKDDCIYIKVKAHKQRTLKHQIENV